MLGLQPESGAPAATGLDIALDRPLPATLLANRASAVFCIGTLVHPRHRVEDLAILVDGVPHRPAAQRMPRLDRHERDPELPSYRSGFWAAVPVPARAAPAEIELAVQARLEDGSAASAPLGTIAVVEPPLPVPYSRPQREGGRPLIAICMATFNPDIELFRVQVESIRAQTDPDWVCVISDDCSEPESFEELAALVADDERFIVTRSEERLGFYRNFERALGLAPAEAELIALSDHDDRWYPDKLAALREAIGSAQLAFSDLRRVDAAGNVRSETLWEGRRNNLTNIASLIVSNSVPGAACMLRRSAIESALPFPSGPGWDFHDHWLALVAMALGELAYVDRPLYDYVQHPRAVLGRVALNGTPPPRPGLRERLAERRGFMRRWRSAYFSLYLQRVLLARVLLARCERELSAPKRRALRRVVEAERSPLAFAWLALRPLRALAGRNETLRVEQVLVRGILWRHLIALRTLGRETPGRAGDDARMPPVDPRSLGPRQRRWLARR